MARSQKSRVSRGQKCNAGSPSDDVSQVSDPALGTPSAAPRFSRPWMEPFVTKAGSTGDVRAALAALEISLPEYRRARKDYPEFDAACLEVDLAVRESIQGALELRASEGHVGAARLLAGGLGQLGVEEDSQPRSSPLERWAIFQAIRAPLWFDPDSPQVLECPHCLVAIDARIGNGLKLEVVGLHDWGDGQTHARNGGGSV